MRSTDILSRRARSSPASPIRRLAPFAVTARERGLEVHGLNIGQPDLETPPQILDRLASFDEPVLAYGPSEGLPEFRRAISTYYTSVGLDVPADRVFVTTGGSEALLFVFGAIADPGDEILVFEPFYTNYSGFGSLIDVRMTPVTTHAEDGYRLPGNEAIEARLGERTRAIVVCSPNNPTGTVYSREELERLAELCRRHDLWLVSDEVYREFVYDGLEHHSAWSLDSIGDRVVLTESLSKRVSMCGARIGWIATRNRDLLDAILRFGQARLCPPTLEQWLGIGLVDVPASYMEGVVAEYRDRRDVVFDALRSVPGVTVEKPRGAFYLCAKLPIDDGQAFAEFLLKEVEIDGETVMVAPADGFYATEGAGKQEVRIAYVLERDALKRAMAIIEAALKAYPGTG